MPSAMEVQPAKWLGIAVLFDDGKYSVIAGEYDGGRRRLGERWNGEIGTVGFPSQGANPIWHVVPRFLETHVLHGVVDERLRHPSHHVGVCNVETLFAEIRTFVPKA